VSTGEDLRAARAARERFGDQLLANPDVHGVGVGRRRRAGRKTDEYALVVHVLRKLPAAEVAPPRLVPRELRFTGGNGREHVVATDVQERPPPTPERGQPISPLALRRRVRPVPGGMSAGFSGTLGAWVWDTVSGQAVALSNRHVFGSLAGTRIPQPSSDDGGSARADAIASVLRAGSLDAAIAEPLEPDVVSESVVGGGPPLDVVDAAIDMPVQKTGRTTGLTHGVVDLIDYGSGHGGSRADLWIDGDGADFSDGGDSGAVYLERGAGAIVGLHWGGAGMDGVGHPIRAVFADLRLTLLADVPEPADRPGAGTERGHPAPPG
jgi:hypothetical protein